jgi:transcriptional regulator GlxA family with amidase domain
MNATRDGVPPEDLGAAPGERQHISVLPSLGFDLDSVRDEVALVLGFMDRAYREPLEQRDLAATAGLSTRRLQELFQASLANTPTAVLRHIRMLHARQCLLDPTESRSIKQIALDAQIPHLGRFSERYAETFGELPSTTIARVRHQQATRQRHNLIGYFDARTMEFRPVARPGPGSE